MRKLVCLSTLLSLILGAATGFAASKVVLKSRVKTGTPGGEVLYKGPDHYSLARFKAQNHLSPAMNALIKKQQSGAQYKDCSGFLSIPCFNSWFITGYRNSVYTYSMVGHNPKAGGTTNLPNEIIPLEVQLIGPDNTTIIFDFDPTVPNDLGLSDAQLFSQSPIYDASTTYPGGGGLAADKGQFVDTTIRASFNGVKQANWHVVLSPPSFPTVHYVALLFWNKNDWKCRRAGPPPCNTGTKNFPVVNINSISDIFAQLLVVDKVKSTEIPIILTDFVTAFDPADGCCILGFHSAQHGNEGGNSVLVWSWTSYITHNPDNGFTNPFAPFGYDTFIASHEVSELYHDPFVQTTGTLVSPWIDGSVTFAQANLETGDAIEAMKDVDSDYHVPLTTTGGLYNYHTQVEALLQWFTRNPQGPATGPGPGVYSWPNTNTLNNGHPCTSQGFVYGEGPAGFFADNGTANGQCQ